LQKVSSEEHVEDAQQGDAEVAGESNSI
jgi:hypothetical protein